MFAILSAMRIHRCLIALLCAACASSPELESAAPLSVESYRASETSARANAHLILGAREAVLVDAAMTLTDAESLLERVEASGRNLRAIFITDSQPDSYLGLTVLVERFPEARVLSTRRIVADIRARGPGDLKRVRARFGERIASSLIVPEALGGDRFEVDGFAIEVHRFEGGAAPHSAVLYVPAIRSLFAGANVFQGSHLPLRERDIRGWRANLEWIRVHGGIERIYPGHGEATDLSVLDAMLAYMLDFEAAVALGDPDAAVAAMLERYPGYDLERMLRESSVPAYLPGT